ncbi:M13-type metalloendopeptidase [Solilutibacter silvestris]|uniref:Putative metalloendopeptidase n=1 Tax=Solilutibacter silvestris TaxID=1645665 RepID=A0A2K1PY12_9GAMM|nr:M13 family metallopeptidase [Lysobacter silvestris]PNS07678.1 putative metalloendopeptidase [Lysobacter silvestris]
MTRRPLVLALAALLATTPFGAMAAKKKAAPKKAKAEPVAAECADYYDVVNKSWLATNPMPANNVTLSALGQLDARAVQQQRDLLDAAMSGPQNNVQKLLGDFWASGLDEAAVEADGSKPIAPLLARIDGIRRSGDVAASIAALHQVGIPVAFNFAADVDLDDLNRHIGYFSQGGLGLGDPAFYTRQDADINAIMIRYRKYVENILTLTGSQPDKLAQDLDMVIGLETRLAQLSRPFKANPDPRSDFNAVPVASLAAYRNLQLGDFLKAQGVNDDRVSMVDPNYFTQLDLLVKSVPASQWKTYLRYQVGNAMAPYLSRGFRDAEQQFRGVVFRNESAAPPRWQQVLDAINTAAGPMLGHEYTARYLPAATKQRAEAIAQEVRQALDADVQASTWMSATAKAEAQAKMAAMKIEIGAPARDLDYTIQPMGRGSFGSNMLIAATWRHAQEMKRIGKGNADRRWSVLPQSPALGYDPAQNRIIITAAMLQSPVLDMAQANGALYGSFGALTARAMVRAVDAHGQMVDAKGAFRDWWTPADTAAWNDRLARIGSQANGWAYPGLTGRMVNGQLVRDQSLLDFAGLDAAWRALGKGQPVVAADAGAFFSGWARLWPQQASMQAAAIDQASSPYAPGKWRVNGPLAAMPEFAHAFSCKTGQPMALAPAAIVHPWH